MTQMIKLNPCDPIKYKCTRCSTTCEFWGIHSGKAAAFIRTFI